MSISRIFYETSMNRSESYQKIFKLLPGFHQFENASMNLSETIFCQTSSVGGKARKKFCMLDFLYSFNRGLKIFFV